MPQTHPPEPRGRLKDFWQKPVLELVSLPIPTFAPAHAERHQIFSLLTLALIAAYWNGNKRGPIGEYPWRENQRDPNTQRYAGGDYLGHNIACVAVDQRGAILDFDFNHNDLLNSSVEHAESRLVRRLFSLTQLQDYWEGRQATVGIPYSTVLADVSVYTSLESCSQCSGIMALGSVKEVLFLQRDPGQNSIGNILRQLSPVGGRYLPPMPIPGDAVGLSLFNRLVKGYDDFVVGIEKRPFYIAPDGRPDTSPSITSYLCTDLVMELVLEATATFKALTLSHPEYLPVDQQGKPIPSGLSNKECHLLALRFLAYATVDGHRGTPHKL